MTLDQRRAWLAQWDRARGELRRVHALELARMTTDAALRASDAVLGLVDPRTRDPARWTSSGLVAQQRAFHGRR